MVLSAYQTQPLSPSGIAHSVSLHLTSSKAPSSSRQSHRGRLISHIVSARDDVLQVYEVRSRDDTGMVSIYHLRSHQINGIITGLGKCRINSNADDATSSASEGEKDTLIVSFKDAKMTLMQWSDVEADLITISIHTYERAPQMAEGLPLQFFPILQVDPESRCSALLLPDDAMAILPFYKDTAEELDEMLQMVVDNQVDLSIERSLPYAPSFILSLQKADPAIKNIRDFAFLPNFQRPTVAVLFERERTWTGRLNELHDTCAVRIITLDLTSSADASHSVISTRDGLPYSSLYVVAGPQGLGGGVFIVTSYAILHVDQGGRIVGIAVSKWHSQVSRLSLPNASHSDESNQLALGLENSRLVFPDAALPIALLILQDGSIFTINCALEGRTLTSMSLAHKGETVQPSTASLLPGSDLVLISSMVGQSSLIRARKIQVAVEKVEEVEDIDMDLDADLYGDTAIISGTANGSGHSGGRKKLDLQIEQAASIPAFGPILDIAPAVVNDTEMAGGHAQTVICSGANKEGGLIFLEPNVIPRKRRRLALNATNGLWIVRTEVESGQVVIITSSLEGTLLSKVDSNGLVTASTALQGRTIFAMAVPGSSSTTPLVLRATPRSIETLTEEGKALQTLRLGQQKDRKEEIYKVEYQAGLLTVLWTDGSFQVFAVHSKGAQAIDLPDDINGRKFISANVVVDKYDSLHRYSQDGIKQEVKANASTLINEDEEIDYGDDFDDTVKEDATKINGHASNIPIWLVLTSSEACVQIYSMKDLSTLAWQSNSLYPAPSRLDYVSNASEEEEAASMELSQVQISHIGDILHLTVAFENGLINVYEAVPFSGDDEDTLASVQSSSKEILHLSFIKVLARQLDGSGASIMNPPNGDRATGLNLVPFQDLRGYEGIFIGGLTPAWLLRSDQGLLHLHMSAEASMDSFDIVQEGGKTNHRFFFTQYGMVHLAEFPPLDYTQAVAHQRKARTGRTYTKVAPHPFTKTVVTSSLLEHQFVLFDPEDGHVVEDPLIDPTIAKTYRSALELFADDDDEPIDGFEFEQCEVVCCIELVTLRSVATISGLKDYIAVGTIISHGEDRPAKGATYLFDVVEVVATDQDPTCRFKLKLVMKDDAKGPITAITDMNGYLVTVMGLKLFVRSLEKDEWLITIAFLDTPYHATGIKRLKNFLLLSDVKKSLWFVAFQEEPYRLVPISKDHAEMHASTGNFIVKDEDLIIVSSDQEGILRIHDYSPSIPASQGGQRLITRTEFNTGVEASTSLVIPGPASSDGGISTSSEVVYGLMNGAIETLLPVTEDVFNVLHLLQVQLIRNVQHCAGLNPRGHRTVRNDHVSRPLTKGILDGRLLQSFEMLPRPKMDELARLIPDLVDGSDQLLRFIHTLRSNWGSL